MFTNVNLNDSLMQFLFSGSAQFSLNLKINQPTSDVQTTGVRSILCCSDFITGQKVNVLCMVKANDN